MRHVYPDPPLLTARRLASSFFWDLFYRALRGYKRNQRPGSFDPEDPVAQLKRKLSFRL